MRVRGIQDWLREPLVHFLALGALFFALHSWVGRGEKEDPRPRIDITAADIAGLQGKWTAIWGRPPTEAELRQGVEDEIRELVLFREALAMDLDKDDVVLRRRMVQRMELLFEDLGRLSGPTDAEMTAFFAENSDKYRTPARVSFTHVYFNPDPRGGSVEQDAALVLERLRSEELSRAPEAGDRFLRPYDYSGQSQAEVGLIFGDAFAADLFALSPGDWEGPVASSYGVHLVRVSGCENGRTPAFEEVRGRVRQDFEAERRRQARELMYESLRERYQVTIDEAALLRAIPAPEQGIRPETLPVMDDS